GETSVLEDRSVKSPRALISIAVSPEGAATPAPPFTLPFDAFSVFEYKTIDARIEGNATRSFGDHTLRAGVGGIHQSSFDIVDQRNFLLTPLGPVPGPSPTLLDAQDLGQPPQTDGTTRHVGYAFVQDEWQISSDLTATVGMRFDHYSDLGGTFNPRASLVWTPTLTTTVKLLYGSAFRPPTFLESATDENGPIVSGSAELNAETVDTFEAAIEQRLAPDLRLSLNGFFYRTDEEILVENTLAGPRFLNGMGVRGVGMEASLVYAPKGPIRVRANYALADVTNRETETAAPNVARHIAFVDLGVAPTPSFAINTILSYVGERSRAFADPRPPLDDYLRTDLTLRYTPRGLEGLSATLAARNLFDADLADPTTDALFAPGDLPLEGRRLTFFVDFSF
ncbi:MAG: TonB-dependent receptor, partial [Pseudomonadota bacterium]